MSEEFKQPCSSFSGPEVDETPIVAQHQKLLSYFSPENVLVNCPVEKTNPIQQTKTVRSIIQVIVIKHEEQGMKRDTGHQRQCGTEWKRRQV